MVAYTPDTSGQNPLITEPGVTVGGSGAYDPYPTYTTPDEVNALIAQHPPKAPATIIVAVAGSTRDSTRADIVVPASASNADAYINQAIAACNGRGKVVLLDGVYNCSSGSGVAFNAASGSVYLEGQGKGATILTTSVTGSILINASFATRCGVSKLSVTSSTSSCWGYLIASCGATGGVPGFDITDVEFTNLYITGLASSCVNSRFSNNVSNASGSATWTSCSDSVVSYNLFTTGTSQFNLAFSGGSGLRIHDNVATGTTSSFYPVANYEIFSCTNVRFFNNYANGSTYTGLVSSGQRTANLYLVNTTHSRINDNTFVGNTDEGVMLYGMSWCDFSGNEVANGADAGVMNNQYAAFSGSSLVVGNCHNTFSRNKIYNNGWEAFVWGNSGVDTAPGIVTSGSSGATVPASGVAETWTISGLSSAYSGIFITPDQPIVLRDTANSGAPTNELVLVTNTSLTSGMTSLNVIRGAFGTTPTAHATGARFRTVSTFAENKIFGNHLSRIDPNKNGSTSTTGLLFNGGGPAVNNSVTDNALDNWPNNSAITFWVSANNKVSGNKTTRCQSVVNFSADSQYNVVTDNQHDSATYVVDSSSGGTNIVLDPQASGSASALNGVTVTGTPSTNQVLKATSSSAATWKTPSFFDVRDYGAVTNGGDITVAWKAAYAAAKAAGTGGVVLVPPGSYTVSDTIPLAGSIEHRGSGFSTTTITQTVNKSLFALDTSDWNGSGYLNWAVRHMTLTSANGAVTTYTNSAIDVTATTSGGAATGKYGAVEWVYVAGWSGIGISFGAYENKINHCHMSSIGNHGIYSNNGADFSISDVWIQTTGTNVSTGCDIYLNGGSSGAMSNLQLENSNGTSPDSVCLYAKQLAGLVIDNVTLRGGASGNLVLDYCGGVVGTIQLYTSAANGSPTVRLKNSNGQHDLKFVGFQATINASATLQFDSGATLAGSTLTFTGSYLASSPATGVTAANLGLGTATASKVVGLGNVLTSASGYADLAANSTRKTVTHGLLTTPTSVQISPVATTGGAVPFADVVSFNPTTFDLCLSATSTSVTRFTWRAECGQTLSNAGLLLLAPPQLSHARVAAWFSADALTGRGSTPPSNGATVTAWNDLSGLSLNVGTGAGNAPTFATNVSNGLPGIVFNGGRLDSSTNAITGLSGTAACAVFVVHKRNGANNASDKPIIASKSNYGYTHKAKNGGAIYVDAYQQINVLAATPTSAESDSSTPIVVDASRQTDGTYGTTAEVDAWKNGTKLTTTASPAGFGNMGTFTIGGDATGSYYSGTVMELVVIAGLVTDAEMVLLTRYLGNKYGITVA